MPHRVTSFFRSSTASLETQVSNLKKSAVNSNARSTSSAASSHSSGSSERVFSYASTLDDDDDVVQELRPRAAPAVKMGNPSEPARRNSPAREQHKDQQQHHHHRLSFPSLHIGRSSRDSHVPVRAAVAGLDWKLESPPAVFYGDTENSTGALVSGQLCLDVKEDSLEIDSLTAKLSIHVTQKRPFASHCSDCANQYTEIEKWNFLTQPMSLTKGVHEFPFSVLLGGHLPATTDGPVVAIAYEFKAEVVPKPTLAHPSASPIRLDRILDVKRSMAVPEIPHQSVRVFPPTNIKAAVNYQQVIHPIGVNTLKLRLDGISKVNHKAGTFELWRITKITWKLEESAKTVAPACAKHAPREPQETQNKKGLPRTDTRVIGERTLFTGWKSNYSLTSDSSVELELEYSISKGGKYCCDMKARDGSEVSHQLMVEMVVSQEWAPLKKPSLVTQTGVGRILRMHFGTVLTERGGIGISWDNEAPPIYQEVPPSPPAYSCETRIALQQASAGEGLAGSATVPEFEEAIEPLDGATRRSSDV